MSTEQLFEASTAVEPRTTDAPSAATAPAVEHLFLTCACGREAAVKIETPWGTGAWCSRHAVSFLGDFPAHRFKELSA